MSLGIGFRLLSDFAALEEDSSRHVECCKVLPLRFSYMVISTNAQCDRELLDSRVHMFQHPWPPGVERTRPLQQGPGYAELVVLGRAAIDRKSTRLNSSHLG